MLQKLTDEIAECYRHARECHERAKQSHDPATKEDLFRTDESSAACFNPNSHPSVEDPPFAHLKRAWRVACPRTEPEPWLRGEEIVKTARLLSLEPAAHLLGGSFPTLN
jgi:hypothetical protein